MNCPRGESGIDGRQNKKERRKIFKTPPGTVEYTVGPQDTMMSVALKYNTTPNKLVQLNRLFCSTIVPGQTLFVPNLGPPSPEPCSPTSTVSSSELELDTLPDTDFKPISWLFSPEDKESPGVEFLKLSCSYVTDDMGVVGGVMIVTPNSIMFDPHKSDPLVIEHGWEDYVLTCPLEKVVSIALYDDASPMQLQNTQPLDHSQNLFPQDSTKCNSIIMETDESGGMNRSLSDKGFVDSESLSNMNINKSRVCLDSSRNLQANIEAFGESSLPKPGSPLTNSSEEGGSTQVTAEVVGVKEEREEKGPACVHVSVTSERPLHISDQIQITDRKPVSEVHAGIGEREVRISASATNSPKDAKFLGAPIGLSNSLSLTAATGVAMKHFWNIEESGKCSCQGLSSMVLNGEKVNLSEEERGANIQESWLLKRMQEPIEDMLLSKKQKSKTASMFLCFKVDKPMINSFPTGQIPSSTHHHRRKGKQPEYWFAVSQDRVDHLYAFFVQWSPDIYGKSTKEPGFIVVPKNKLSVIDSLLSHPAPKSWEIVKVNDVKRRQSICSSEDEETEDLLPVLRDHSQLLEEAHIQRLANRLPARMQGYPWRLVYSTAVHGTSLKTLYRNLSQIDSPVLLVIKDMDNEVFGAFSSHPFRVSNCCYGTGETFLYSFSPEFKVFHWSGENSYFVKGDQDSLHMGGGGGHFGLWLDAELYHGCSLTCDTFHNQPLSAKRDFIIQDLEVWAFH